MTTATQETMKPGDKVRLYGRVFVIRHLMRDEQAALEPARMTRLDYRNPSWLIASTADLEAHHTGLARESARLSNGAGHCQICERVIMTGSSKSPVIAHHGYERPAFGWQTGSCYGARHLPWETDCSVLQMYVDNVLTRRLVGLEDHEDSLFQRGDHRDEAIKVPGPEVPKLGPDGKPLRDLVTGRREYTRPLIGAEHAQFPRYLQEAREKVAREISQLKQVIAYQTDRLKNWKPKT